LTKTAYLGEGDLHDPAFDDTKINFPVILYMKPETYNATGHCAFSLSIYKTKNFEGTDSSSMILIFSLAIVIFFAFKAVTFYMYDRFVRQRNAKMIYVAARSNAIISSMFPTDVRERLFFESDEKNAGSKISNGQKVNLQSKLSTAQQANDEKVAKIHEKPNADLFLETTILFADIVGFTAWSSVREPSQVFVLLETIFQAFDDIARKRRVFKVETVGDCYVAVAGLPQPRPDHAIVMARFAHDCMVKMLALVKKLELTLGPDTGDLSMRMGLHSGPVTAGVLRGDRSRFQLFGDTMNTAARMEHTGLRGKIQLSQETAALLSAAGKIGWLNSRDDGTFIRLPLYLVV
jgi:class 3 adenylate cyclase